MTIVPNYREKKITSSHAELFSRDLRSGRYSLDKLNLPECNMGELFLDTIERFHLDCYVPIYSVSRSESRKLRGSLLEESSRPSRSSILLKGFSFKDYMEYALYDPIFGYYTTKDSVGTDFKTKPLKYSPQYGKWLSELVFKLWLNMLYQGIITPKDQIEIIEFGAGTGQLACDILENLKRKSQKTDTYPTLRNFYRRCHYTIYEISPKLRKMQLEKNQHLLDKLTIKPGDARSAPEDCKGRKGFIISNELPDAFSMHKIRKSEDGNRIEVEFIFPRIRNAYCFELTLPQKLLTRIQLNDLEIRRCLNLHKSFLSHLFLTKEDYILLRKSVADTSLFDYHVIWMSCWLNYEYVNEVYKFCQRHTPFLAELEPGKSIPLNTDLSLFQRATSSMLEKGYKITIDYQFDAKQILKEGDLFRCYPGGTPHDFRDPPGSKDITADVCASALAVEGIAHGWIPIYFGTERSLLPMASQEVATMLTNDRIDFNVLIEKKGGIKKLSELPMLGLPVTYRDLLIQGADRLSQSGDPDDVHHENIFLASISIHFGIYFTKKEQPHSIKKATCLEYVFRTIEHSSIRTKEAIEIIVDQLFGKNNLYTIAKKFDGLETFDFSLIDHYYDPKKSAEVNSLVFLIVRQLLNIYYFNKVNYFF